MKVKLTYGKYPHIPKEFRGKVQELPMDIRAAMLVMIMDDGNPGLVPLHDIKSIEIDVSKGETELVKLVTAKAISKMSSLLAPSGHVSFRHPDNTPWREDEIN